MLRSLHAELGFAPVDVAVVEQLFKRYDMNSDNSLAFQEFFELFKGELRRSAFDRSSMVSREFFITRREEDVWSIYDKKKELGAGSFGQAFLAKHRVSGDDRCVKAVQKTRTSLPLDDIEKEILIMRQVDHPHIVRLFEWFEDNSRFYLVLEALKGGTLKEVMLHLQSQKKGIRESWTQSVLAQVVDAMAFCHNLRLIHKDIKDENIMLLRKDPDFDEPFAVIIDLGIAEMFSTADPVGREMGGTPLTMAPEVWKGSFGPKCDVFSLGCVLFQLLSGNYPFMATTLRPQAWLRLHKRGPNWSMVKASPSGKDMCQQMLAYDEHRRPSMAELCEHEYLQEDESELTNSVSAEQFDEFTQFCHMQDVKRSLLLEIAAQLPLDRAGEVIELFESLDDDASGHLSQQELEMFFNQMGIQDQGLIGATFGALDVDTDGTLSFSEFSAGALLLFKDKLEERLLHLFRQHDVNGNHFLDLHEAHEFLEDATAAVDKNHRGPDADQMMQRVIKDAEDGVLSYEQLRKHILANVNSRPSTIANSSRRSSARC